MKIKEVRITPGCIACGTCEAVCPEAFSINDVSRVKEEVDLQKYEDCIKEAARVCPVNVIEIVPEENL